ncbi:hypothetical protein E3T34_09385 [Cryobacterium sp. TMT1-62]|uniref:DUF732 domain-containing protein n=1 Tax=Cryobacterium sandaracinum TaxID=1259247 RepID=A0ABY2JB24_9MICO|nr:MULTISPECIES: hypothetical protein [Cryobacterium]TFD02036.1 hypothetical protein E3T25_10170 [Cryobacterium sandaracinum]TFD32151.1 hypothetical protein E3T34_09385 [Cryobacterium sp. TMT1-62]
MTHDSIRLPSARGPHASARTFLALVLAGFLLTGASCARSGTSSLDDLGRILGRSANETELIVGGGSAAAEKNAARWLEQIEAYGDSDVRAACNLALAMSGSGTPKTQADLKQLLQLTSAITNPTAEVTNLRDTTASALIEDYQSASLAAAIVAFDETLC